MQVLWWWRQSPSRLGYTVLAVALLALGAAGGLLPSAHAQASQVPRIHKVLDENCRHVPLSRRPGWTISGAWTGDGGDLLLVDTLYNKVLRYSEGGATQSSIPDGVAASLANFFPSRIATRQDGNLLLELASGRLVTLDRRYIPSRKKNILAEGARGGVQITSMFLWDVAGDDVVSLSDLKGPGPTERSSAFLRIPLSDPANFTVLKPLPGDASRSIFRLGYSYIASLDTTAYVLLFDDHVRIYRNVKGTTDLLPLKAFPESFDLAPLLPRFTEREDYPIVMAAVEKATMAVGLYGWKNDLYVLTRTPSGGGTRWGLVQIDPATDEVTGTAVIPTRANHLTVVPGSQAWAFVEKGPVRALGGDQETDTILYVPASRISRIHGTVSGDICQ